MLGWNGQPSDSASSGPKGPLSSFGSAEVLVTGSMRSKLALELKRQLTEEKSMAGGAAAWQTWMPVQLVPAAAQQLCSTVLAQKIATATPVLHAWATS